MTDLKEIVGELNDAERYLGQSRNMLSCPYLTGGNTCISGCWSEPRCITKEPVGGWEGQARASALWARDLAKELRGHHGLVKRARDITRHAARLELA